MAVRRQFEATSHAFNFDKICGPPQTIRFFTKVDIIIIIIIIIMNISMWQRKLGFTTSARFFFFYPCSTWLDAMNINRPVSLSSLPTSMGVHKKSDVNSSAFTLHVLPCHYVTHNPKLYKEIFILCC